MIEFLQKNPALPIYIISAIIAFLSYLFQVKLARVKHSIDFQNSYHDSKDLMASIAKVKELSTLNKDEITALAINGNQDVVTILNTWERAAIAIKKSIYDEEVLYLAYGTTVIQLWTKLSPFIKKRQEKNPRLYVNFDWLAVKWMAKRNESKSKSELKKLKEIQSLIKKLNC